MLELEAAVLPLAVVAHTDVLAVRQLVFGLMKESWFVREKI